MQFIRILKFILFSLSFSLVIQSCAQTNKGFPKAEKGILNLQNWNFTNSETFLDGEWEFYPFEFIDPAQPARELEKQFIQVPGIWNQTMKQGKGYASYRLQVLLPESNSKPLTFKVMENGTAYKMFVNGIEVAANGQIGKTKEENIAEHLPLVVPLKNYSSKIDIVFHISNFHYTDGGLWYSIQFGEDSKIRKAKENKMLLTLFLCGSISIMAIYHIAVYLFRRKDKSALAFSLFCVAIDFRLLEFNEKFLNLIFVGDYFLILNRIEYLAYYLAIPFFASFQQIIFPNEFKKVFLYFFWIISSLFSLVVLSFDSFIYTHTAFYYHIYVLFFMCYSIFVMIKAVTNNRDESKIFTFGMFLLFAVTINDILHSKTIIQTEFMAPYGLFGFIFIQSIMLSMRFSKGFNMAENLSHELILLNASLEDKILERTKELTKQKEIAEEASLIKDKFVSIVSHDLRSPLLGVSNILEIIDKKEIVTTEEERKQFLEMSRESIKFSLKMINELLSLSRIETGTIKVNKKKVSLLEITNLFLKELEPQAKFKNIPIQTDIANGMHINIDLELFTQVIKNLLTNAIKFTEPGGNILLKGFATEIESVIEIHDNGVGMSAEDLNSIFEPGAKKTSLGTSGEIGSGMGLFICKYIVDAHNGEIQFESKKDIGTICRIILPP
ncbi:MAG: sensor histidine kinase [Leptospiraceae bacterium]|nr:sensor histidine kinase [Leptospiraceae bacterium]